jgi:hypothetical protein
MLSCRATPDAETGQFPIKQAVHLGSLGFAAEQRSNAYSKPQECGKRCAELFATYCKNIDRNYHAVEEQSYIFTIVIPSNFTQTKSPL